MADRAAETDQVVYNNGATVEKQCLNHTHRRPIHLSTLTKVVYAREETARRHVWHFMPEAGCSLCAQGVARG